MGKVVGGLKQRSFMSLVATYSFFFNDTATTEIYTLSLHDALPICPQKLIILIWLADMHYIRGDGVSLEAARECFYF